MLLATLPSISSDTNLLCEGDYDPSVQYLANLSGGWSRRFLKLYVCLPYQLSSCFITFAHYYVCSLGDHLSTTHINLSSIIHPCLPFVSQVNPTAKLTIHIWCLCMFKLTFWVCCSWIWLISYVLVSFLSQSSKLHLLFSNWWCWGNVNIYMCLYDFL